MLCHPNIQRRHPNVCGHPSMHGDIQTYGDLQTYGSIQTYGGCPNIQGAYTPVPTQHKESTLCQTNGVSICSPFIWIPHMFGCPLYVWMPPVCLDAPMCMRECKCMGASKHMGCPNIQGNPNIWGCPNIWGGIQTYRWASKHMGSIQKYRGNPNIWGPSKHTGGIPACLSFPRSGYRYFFQASFEIVS